jgi:hypothetical protein
MDFVCSDLQQPAFLHQLICFVPYHLRKEKVEFLSKSHRNLDHQMFVLEQLDFYTRPFMRGAQLLRMLPNISHVVSHGPHIAVVCSEQKFVIVFDSDAAFSIPLSELASSDILAYLSEEKKSCASDLLISKRNSPIIAVRSICRFVRCLSAV